jgi:hypothetical protein
MGRSLVEKVIVPALEALKDKNEQMWLGVTVATLLVLLFGPGGVTTGSQANNAAGHYTGGPSNPPTSSNNPHAVARGQKTVVQSSNEPISPSRTLPNQPPPVKEPAKKDKFAVSSGTPHVIESLNEPISPSRTLPSQSPLAKEPAKEK